MLKTILIKPMFTFTQKFDQIFLNLQDFVNTEKEFLYFKVLLQKMEMLSKLGNNDDTAF